MFLTRDSLLTYLILKPIFSKRTHLNIGLQWSKDIGKFVGLLETYQGKVKDPSAYISLKLQILDDVRLGIWFIKYWKGESPDLYKLFYALQLAVSLREEIDLVVSNIALEE